MAAAEWDQGNDPDQSAPVDDFMIEHAAREHDALVASRPRGGYAITPFGASLDEDSGRYRWDYQCVCGRTFWSYRARPEVKPCPCGLALEIAPIPEKAEGKVLKLPVKEAHAYILDSWGRTLDRLAH